MSWGFPRLKPTIFHVTHHKSGSQWVAEILQHCALDRFRRPKLDLGFFYDRPIDPGNVYLTVYVPKGDFDAVTWGGNGNFPGRRRFCRRHPKLMARNWFHFGLHRSPIRRFVVIRDLRDTLVSLYFSVKVSHVFRLAWQFKSREVLKELSKEDGFLCWIGEGNRTSFDGWLRPPFLKEQYSPIENADSPQVISFMEGILDYIAEIQTSWTAGEDLVVRYEDLVADEYGTFEKIVDHCQIDVDLKRLHEIIRNNRFETVTGRRRGEEDVAAHQRKGIVGDWRNHFSDRIKDRFKARFGDVLIRTGYETGLDW